jgi:hypothetical protein
LEITFLKNFCRAGNLRALLDRPEFFPEALRPYIADLQKLYDPSTAIFTPKLSSHPLYSKHLSSPDCQKLVDYLNAKSSETTWAVASDWSVLSKHEQTKVSPLSSQCQVHRYVDYKDVSFSAWEENPNNSIIAVDTTLPKLLHFARIESIFTHVRLTTTQEKISDTWLKVRPLPPLPPTVSNIFADLEQPHLQLDLRLPVTDEEHIINITDVVSHCAWIEYKAGELVSKIKRPVVALVSLDRD